MVSNAQTKLSYETSIAVDGMQSKKLANPQYIEKKLRDMIVEMIIVDEKHFLMVKGRGFHKFVQCLKPLFFMHSW